jgi:hypothetical protein
MRRKRKVAETATLNNRSRITNGTQFLPCIHEQSIWARTCRDTYAGLVSHCGGNEGIPLTQQMTARHTAILDTELIFLGSKIGQAREKGEEPPPQTLDLYTRLLNALRRQCEALGWQRTARDITPTETLEEAVAKLRRAQAADVEGSDGA